MSKSKYKTSISKLRYRHIRISKSVTLISKSGKIQDDAHDSESPAMIKRVEIIGLDKLMMKIMITIMKIIRWRKFA